MIGPTRNLRRTLEHQTRLSTQKDPRNRNRRYAWRRPKAVGDAYLTVGKQGSVRRPLVLRFGYGLKRADYKYRGLGCSKSANPVGPS